MTSRERVVEVLKHREADRVPLDIGGGSGTSMIQEAYQNLLCFLGMENKTELLHETNRTVKMDQEVLQVLGCDCIPLLPDVPKFWKLKPTGSGSYIDLWGVEWKKVQYSSGSLYYYEVTKSPLEKATIPDLDSYPWPDPLDTHFAERLEEESKYLFEKTSFAIVADTRFRSFFELAFVLRGFEQILMDLILDPDFVTALFDKILNINLSAAERFLQSAGKYIQVIKLSDDLATQSGPLMSLDTYRSLLKPVHQKFIEVVKSLTDAKIYYHSCGNVTSFLDDMIDIGIDIINPVQVSAEQMGNTKNLEKRYGDRLSFWGAIDTQSVLPYGSPLDVFKEVQKRITDLGSGGGFVAAAVHSIQSDVPPQNVVAMADAVKKLGSYR